MDRIFGMLVIDVTSTNRIQMPVTLRRPWGGQRLLKIRRGYYGHPRGMTSQGRMCYEVTEILQVESSHALPHVPPPPPPLSLSLSPSYACLSPCARIPLPGHDRPRRRVVLHHPAAHRHHPFTG